MSAIGQHIRFRAKDDRAIAGGAVGGWLNAETPVRVIEGTFEAYRCD